MNNSLNNPIYWRSAKNVHTNIDFGFANCLKSSLLDASGEISLENSVEFLEGITSVLKNKLQQLSEQRLSLRYIDTNHKDYDKLFSEELLDYDYFYGEYSVWLLLLYLTRFKIDPSIFFTNLGEGMYCDVLKELIMTNGSIQRGFLVQYWLEDLNYEHYSGDLDFKVEYIDSFDDLLDDFSEVNSQTKMIIVDTLQNIYRLIVIGQLDEAIKVAEDAGLHAVSGVLGGFMLPHIEENVVLGNINIFEHRKNVYSISKLLSNEHNANKCEIRKYLSGIYGLLSGNIDAALSIARTPYERMYVFFRSYVESSLEEYVKQNKISTSLVETLDACAMTDAPFAFEQRFCILDLCGEYLRGIVDTIEDESTITTQQLRFATHIAVLMVSGGYPVMDDHKYINMDIHEAHCAYLIESYCDNVLNERNFGLFSLYAVLLPLDIQEELLIEFLKLFSSDKSARSLALNSLKDVDVDVEALAKCVAFDVATHIVDTPNVKVPYTPLNKIKKVFDLGSTDKIVLRKSLLGLLGEMFSGCEDLTEEDKSNSQARLDILTWALEGKQDSVEFALVTIASSLRWFIVSGEYQTLQYLCVHLKEVFVTSPYFPELSKTAECKDIIAEVELYMNFSALVRSSQKLHSSIANSEFADSRHSLGVSLFDEAYALMQHILQFDEQLSENEEEKERNDQIIEVFEVVVPLLTHLCVLLLAYLENHNEQFEFIFYLVERASKYIDQSCLELIIEYAKFSYCTVAYNTNIDNKEN
ncbi:hypothetical protein PCE1_001895 [Barthelona sp. PCE]